MGPADIVQSFFSESATYARQEMEAAVASWGEVAPLLIARTLQRADELRADPTLDIADNGLAYAINLFGHLRDPAAWPALYAVCTLPDETADEHIGGRACEELGQVLYRCCNGELTKIGELLQRQDANQWVRVAALHALLYAAAEGQIGRAPLLEALLTVIEADEGPVDSFYLRVEAGGSLLDFHPHEHAQRIAKLVEDGVYEPEQDDDEVAELLQEDLAACQKALDGHLSGLSRYEPADVHGRMSWWACFQPRMRGPGQVDLGARTSLGNSARPARESSESAWGAPQGKPNAISAAERQARKRKAQLAKKSKKANRRKK